MERIYFDHSSTTPVDEKVAKAMLDTMLDNFGNPSSIHFFGRQARKAVEEAREKVATLLNAQPTEIFFTSGGTEADNLAIKGIALANQKKRAIILLHQPLNIMPFSIRVNILRRTVLPLRTYRLINMAW